MDAQKLYEEKLKIANVIYDMLLPDREVNMEGNPHTHQLTLARNYRNETILTYGDTSIRVFSTPVDLDSVAPAELYKAMKIARDIIVEQHDRGSKAAAIEAQRAQKAQEQRNHILRMLQPPRPDMWFSETFEVTAVDEPPSPVVPRVMPREWSLLGA